MVSSCKVALLKLSLMGDIFVLESNNKLRGSLAPKISSSLPYQFSGVRHGVLGLFRSAIEFEVVVLVV